MNSWRVPVLVLLALIALPMLALGPEYWSPRSPSHQPPPHADGSAAYGEKQAKQQARDSDAPTVVVEPASAQEQRRPAATGDRQVNGQDALARYTFWLTAFTCVLAVATAALVVLGIRQFLDSRILQRAYVKVEPVSIFVRTDAEIIGLIEYVNVGHLPARNFGNEARIKWSRSGDLKEFEALTIKDAEIILPVQTKMPRGTPILSAEDRGHVLAKQGYLYVFGVAEYRDGFNRKRWLKFCHRYNCARAAIDGSIDVEHARHHGAHNDGD